MPFLSDSVAFPPSLYTVPCCLFLSCAFCPFASTTCCGSICWTVGRKRLHFTEALQVMSGPSNRRFPLELQSWEQWERGSTWLGALMEKVEMPSPCHCQEEQNIEQSAGVHLGSLGWGSGCEAGGWSSSCAALATHWTVSAAPPLYHCWSTWSQNLSHS